MSMHACIYVSLEGGGWQAVCMQMHSIPLCASHGNGMRACTNAILCGWSVLCMVDGWMIVDCDEWQW